MLIIIITNLLFLYSCIPTNTFNDKSDMIEYRLIKLHYENSGGEKGLTTFEYDENGNHTVSFWELLDGSRNSLNYYRYDNNGNLIKKYREFSDGITATELFEYDEVGNLIKEDFQRSDGVKGTTTYEYDKNDVLLLARCNGLKGWFYGEIHYVYDERGFKIRGDFELTDQNKGTITYSYDGNNNLISEYWDFSGEWNQTFIYEYDPILYSSED